MSKQRLSSKNKAEMVLRILRGESIETVSREKQVTVADLTKWREEFIKNGTDGFKRNPEQSQLGRYERIIGRQQMQIELLKKKRDSLGHTQGIS